MCRWSEMFTKDSPIWPIWSRLPGAAPEPLLRANRKRGRMFVNSRGLEATSQSQGEGRFHLWEKQPWEVSHPPVGAPAPCPHLVQSSPHCARGPSGWGCGGGGEGLSGMINIPLTLARFQLFKPLLLSSYFLCEPFTVTLQFKESL